MNRDAGYGQTPACEIQTQIREGGPRGWAAATKRTGGARG